MATATLHPDSILELLQMLIRIPSVNPHLARGEASGERVIARAAVDWMLQHGIRGWMEEPEPGRANAVGEIGNGKGPSIVFCAHLDTVSATGMEVGAFGAEVRHGRVYGLGAYDMKGSAAAILSAAAALAQEEINGKVLLALVCDEEYASIGAQHFVKHYPANACVLTEPSEGKLILAHKGFVWTEIVTTGRAAHGSRWDLGKSAIAAMGRIIAALDDFDRRELRQRTHPLVGPASLHCSEISGGTGISTYADRCLLHVERRTVPGETTQQVLEELNQAVAAAGESARITCMLDRPPLECDREAPIAECVRRAAKAVTGNLPEESGVAYWMDAALFAAAGIPTVNYGPAGRGAHEPVEWVELNSVVSCAEIYAQTARLAMLDSAVFR